MKTILSLFLALLCVQFAQAQMSCCVKATDQFANMAKDKKFRDEHAEPLPFEYVAKRGADINYKLTDGTTAHAFEIKAEKTNANYLFVIHEWWGLNDYIKQESERLADELGINVIALDLYDNKATTDREEAGKLMQGANNARIMSIIKGAFAYVGDKANVYTLGWCFGGGWSLQTALLGGSQVKGCVMYYGMPEQDVSKLKTLNCDVIGFFAKKDGHITPEVVKQFEDNMKAAGKNVKTYEYDADHAFANPSNPVYNKEAAADANAKALAFLQQRIK